jgi:hypothetical protein
MGCDYCYATDLVIVFKVNEKIYTTTIKGKANAVYFSLETTDDEEEETMNNTRRPLECIYENGKYVSNTEGLYDEMINNYISEHNERIERYIEYHNNIKNDEYNAYYATKIASSNIVNIGRETVVWRRY